MVGAVLPPPSRSGGVGSFENRQRRDGVDRVPDLKAIEPEPGAEPPPPWGPWRGENRGGVIETAPTAFPAQEWQPQADPSSANDLCGFAGWTSDDSNTSPAVLRQRQIRVASAPGTEVRRGRNQEHVEP